MTTASVRLNPNQEVMDALESAIQNAVSQLTGTSRFESNNEFTNDHDVVTGIANGVAFESADDHEAVTDRSTAVTYEADADHKAAADRETEDDQQLPADHQSMADDIA